MTLIPSVQRISDDVAEQSKKGGFQPPQQILTNGFFSQWFIPLVSETHPLPDSSIYIKQRVRSFVYVQPMLTLQTNKCQNLSHKNNILDR